MFEGITYKFRTVIMFEIFNTHNKKTASNDIC
jgi:hypothetical protein